MRLQLRVMNELGLGLTLVLLSCSRIAHSGAETLAASATPVPALAPVLTSKSAPRVTTTAPTVYRTRGTVRSLEPAQQRVFIAHEEISGYMKGMVMPFRLTPAQARGLAPGVVVEFSFHDDGDGNLIIDAVRRAT